MVADPRKRQKKLERRNSKRKEKRYLVAREQSVGLGERLAAACQYPVLHCLVSGSIDKEGLGQVLLSRHLPDGNVAVAAYLVDRYCLGIKNAHSEILSRANYESKYVRTLRSDMKARELTPATAHKLVDDALAYAHELGFAPHPDYDRAKRLLGDIDPTQSTEDFEFGKDGKPCFINGPHDSASRCRQILAILTNKLGPQGFHFLLGGPVAERMGLGGGSLQHLGLEGNEFSEYSPEEEDD